MSKTNWPAVHAAFDEANILPPGTEWSDASLEASTAVVSHLFSTLGLDTGTNPPADADPAWRAFSELATWVQMAMLSMRCDGQGKPIVTTNERQYKGI